MKDNIVIKKVKEVVDAIYELDCKAYPEEMTSKQWYIDRYDGRESVFVYLLDDEIVGYMAVMDIDKRFVDALMNGVLDGDFVVSNNMFKGDGCHYYIGSCVVDEQHRNKGIFHELLNAVLEEYQNKNLYALTNSQTTIALISSGFKLECMNGNYKTLSRIVI